MFSRAFHPLVCLLAATFVGPACGTSTASTAVAPRSPLSSQAQAQAQAVKAGPAHTFTPRAHPARRRPAVPEPDLASLPALTDRTAQCFGRPQEEVAIARSPAKPSPRRRKSKKTASTRSTKPGFVPFDPAGGSGGGSAGVGRSSSSGAAPSRAPRADPPPAPPPDRKPSPRKNDPRAEKSREARQPAPAAEPSSGARDAELGDAALAVDDGDRARPHGGDAYDDWGAAIYLSNDDTMSLSSAQRVIWAIDNFMPLPAQHIRPHELLNYFSFDTAPVAETDDFSVAAAIAPDLDEEGIYSLALAVKGRPVGVDERRNANVSFVIDRSGSMSAEGRMDYLRRGMQQVVEQLKAGDVVHLVLFDDVVCTPIENFVVGRDDPATLSRAIAALEPQGSTNLHAGLRAGYEIADRAYRPEYTNRVVMITDALTNTGVVDEELISTVSSYYDRRQIRLSGVGVGSDFNDDLLDRLTERGKGAYLFLGSEAEVDAVFGDRFTSLIETTALDVHFRLHLPPSLRMNVFYGEESSTVKEDVQPIHYFANTSQLFLADLMAKGGRLPDGDGIMLTIEYDDPETGQAMVEEYAFELGEIARESHNVRKGRLVMRFVDGLAAMASRPTPSSFGHRAASWEDETGFAQCQEGKADLDRMSDGLEDDPEVRRVLGLWEKYCSRFAAPRHPVRRPVAQDTWPGAVEP